MSLQESDCLPGVEIICINNKLPEDINPLKYFNQWIKIGHIYTVRNVVPDHKTGKPVLQLNEVTGYKSPETGKEYAHWLWRFKKLDPKDIQIFYDILNEPINNYLIKQGVTEDA